MTAIVRVDRNGTISNWSAAAGRLFGFTKLEAIGNSIELIIPPQSHACHGRGFARRRTYFGSERRHVCLLRLTRAANVGGEDGYDQINRFDLGSDLSLS